MLCVIVSLTGPIRGGDPPREWLNRGYDRCCMLIRDGVGLGRYFKIKHRVSSQPECSLPVSVHFTVLTSTIVRKKVLGR